MMDTVFDLIEAEEARQSSHLEMIASENYPSPAVVAAMGSILTAKYAEGYPGHRYYGGCEVVDQIEELARSRALRMFDLNSDEWHVNVQPHSGTQANMAVYLSILQPGDKIMGMSLNAGGHLSHANPQGLAGKLHEAHQYDVAPDTGLIDYDAVLKLAKEVRPKLIICGASAYPRVIDFAKFRAIANEVGAYLMADIAHIAGLVVSGDHPSPFPYADFVTTTTHKTLRGPRGGMVFCRKDMAKTLDTAVFPRLQGGPLMHVIAAKAICFGEALTPNFAWYQHQVIANAKQLETEFKRYGLPMVTGGTDNHLLLLNTWDSIGLTGKQAEDALAEIHITVNKNSLPGDKLPIAQTSGIRIGTPALTTRGMREPEMREIAAVIHDALGDYAESVRHQSAEWTLYARPRFQDWVKSLTTDFPLVKYQ